jgi:hypothetical protein
VDTGLVDAFRKADRAMLDAKQRVALYADRQTDVAQRPATTGP